MLEPVLSFRASLLAFERQAEELLDVGAEPDAPADMYSGQSATMSMLVSSSQPAQAVQKPTICWRFSFVRLSGVATCMRCAVMCSFTCPGW